MVVRLLYRQVLRVSLGILYLDLVQHFVLLDLLNIFVLGVSDDVDSIVGSGSNLRGKL